jgi:uncharacterized protein (DUF779 family)
MSENYTAAVLTISYYGSKPSEGGRAACGQLVTIRAAHGQFIAFTDADCVADRHWLAELRQQFRLTNADIVLGRLLYSVPTSVFLRCYEHYYHTKITYILGHNLRQCYFGHAGNMAAKASVLTK